ncbi:MAG: DUF1329 domain-containing protein [Desulfatitalea sp.]|nr:DUF1329 domain-containing protein [Desulfatitalea sp.]NNK00564.1 DUF1329 domain-containing protein [Desulfatitalea sp.]
MNLTRFFSIVITSFWIISSAFAADIPKGTTIGPDNWEQYKPYLSLATITQIKRGMRFNVGGDATGFLHSSSGYKKATEKYKGTCSVNADGALQGWVAGRPFPEAIDPNDPQAGIKIAYNLERRYEGDDQTLAKYRLTNVSANGQQRVVEGHSKAWAWLFLKGRTDLAPTPEILPNPDNIWKINTLTMDAPYDLKGTMRLLVRYEDPTKDDDIWMYIPTMRRVRRMSGAQRQNNFAGTVATYDDIRGFQGRPLEYTWQLVDEQKILCAALDAKTPFPRNENGMWTNDRTIRDCWVVDATPVSSTHVYKKRRFWVDKEIYVPWHEIVYDAQDRAWKVFENYNAPVYTGENADKEFVIIEQAFIWLDLLDQTYTLLEYIGWDENGNQTGKISVGLDRDWFTLGTLRKRGRR